MASHQEKAAEDIFPPDSHHIVPPTLTAEERVEFRRLLNLQREYDRKHNELELEEKMEKLRKLADELGVKICFL